MSRYSLTPIKEGYKVDVGYDAHVDSYFLQVRMPNDHGDVQLVQWRGNGVKDYGSSEGIISVPEIILADAARYASIPAGLLETLLEDRDPAPEEVSSDPVIYAGMPNKEVWRHRASVDTRNGMRMKLKPSSTYSFSQCVTMAILRDFVGHEDRARRIVQGISAAVVSKLIERRSWLLTERNMNEAVLAVESTLGLRWLKESKCYAGEGERVDAEMQLRRAGRKRHIGTPAPASHLASV